MFNLSADRIVGKPYLEMEIHRDAIARYGLIVQHLQNILSGAVGGMKLTTNVEGRERFPVRMRYAREFRDNPEDMKKLLVPIPSGAQILLGELITMNYIRGLQLIKSENSQDYFNGLLESGDFELPAGVSHEGHDHSSEDPTSWTCSMRPQIKLDKPGQCPICAMDLISIKTAQSSGDDVDPNEIVLTESPAKLADIQTIIVSKGTPQKSLYLQGKVHADFGI